MMSYVHEIQTVYNVAQDLQMVQCIAVCETASPGEVVAAVAYLLMQC